MKEKVKDGMNRKEKGPNICDDESHFRRITIHRMWNTLLSRWYVESLDIFGRLLQVRGSFRFEFHADCFRLLR